MTASTISSLRVNITVAVPAFSATVVSAAVIDGASSSMIVAVEVADAIVTMPPPTALIITMKVSSPSKRLSDVIGTGKYTAAPETLPALNVKVLVVTVKSDALASPVKTVLTLNVKLSCTSSVKVMTATFVVPAPSSILLKPTTLIVAISSLLMVATLSFEELDMVAFPGVFIATLNVSLLSSIESSPVLMVKPTVSLPAEIVPDTGAPLKSESAEVALPSVTVTLNVALLTAV